MMNDPALEKKADTWVVPTPLDVTFEGFAPEAFAILERLRDEPHIARYRKEKEGIRRYLTDPFKRFRDDLAVNWVLPNRLGFETERNVFSRLLKNDFGAGGCHHHLWMAFYRPPRRRLTDIQLSHSITPGGFTTGLFVGAYAKDLFRRARQHMAAEPERFLQIINPLLQDKNWKACIYHTEKTFFSDPLDEVPDELARATGFFLRCYTSRDNAVEEGGALVGWTIARLGDLWPLYRFILTQEGSAA